MERDRCSFRGASFWLDRHEGTGGRRVVLHEFPQRDEPYAEDLGRGARKFTLSGYVIGPQWLTLRARLVEACEKPGAGTLDHPLWGRILVSCANYRYGESKDESGVSRFTFEFVESGANRYPDETTDTRGALARMVADAREALAAAFDEAFTVVAVGQEAIEDAVFLVGEVAAEIRTAASAALDEVDGFAGGFIVGLGDALAGSAAAYASVGALGSEIVGSLAQMGDAASGSLTADDLADPLRRRRSGPVSPAAASRALLGFAALARFGLDDPSTDRATPLRVRIADNALALEALVRRSAVVERARLATRMEFASADDARDLLTLLLGEIDAEVERAADPAQPGAFADGAYRALTAVRAGLVDHLGAQARALAPLGTWSEPGPRSSLALTWKLTGDIAQADALAKRAGAPHPAFLPREGRYVVR